MTANLLYAIGTLLTWMGWLLAARTVMLGLQLASKTPGLKPAQAQRGLVITGISAAVCLLIGQATPLCADPTAKGPQMPLVWFVMPFAAWLVVGSAAMVMARLAQAFLALHANDRLDKVKAAGVWAVVIVIGILYYRYDPTNKIEVLRGAVRLGFTNAVVVVILVLAGITAMVLTSRATASRGLAKTVITQATLIAGSVVFGLPFAFLVITSFKEDRDMSSPNGIVWVPKVQETVPFFDKKEPMYEVTNDGQQVQGTIIEHKAGNVVRIDVLKPFALRGQVVETSFSKLKEVPKDAPLVTGTYQGKSFTGMVVQEMDDGHRRVSFTQPESLKGKEDVFAPTDVEPVRHVGLRVQNYPEALSYLPPETHNGLVYLKNTLFLVVTSVLGTILSSSIVAYAFSRMNFPGKNALFAVLLSTMMLPGAVTLLPQFLIFRYLGWIDTLYPLWVPAFFASAFNVFLLRQFFMSIPMELEDAAKIDGCTYIKTFWSIMMPQIKPALAVIAIWTFMGAWNNFMGPLIYINSPEHMPLSYALQLFQGDRSGDPGLLMAFATLCMMPVLALFFFTQKYFIEGVTLSGLGGR